MKKRMTVAVLSLALIFVLSGCQNAEIDTVKADSNVDSSFSESSQESLFSAVISTTEENSVIASESQVNAEESSTSNIASPVVEPDNVKESTSSELEKSNESVEPTKPPKKEEQPTEKPSPKPLPAEPPTVSEPNPSIDEPIESPAPETESIETQVTEPESIETPVTEPEPIKAPTLEPELEFDISYWISYAQGYVESKGLVLNSEAVECWDNPISAGTHCKYLERDIQSRLNRYAKDEDITDVWIWAENTESGTYDLYIGYA